jgi:D-alanine-D-alanine ligase
MRIALTHNLQVVGGEEEAEFDSPRTISSLAEALRRLGHDVDLMEVSGPVGQLVAAFESRRPDLVLNTAEGQRGRCREAFYPALFEQLGLPYTGSDPYACTVTLDKHLSKMIAARAGVPTPGWSFLERADDPVAPDLQYPLIVKPNFEGSSKGITPRSIVRDPSELRARIEATFASYPGGVLVEEFILGEDVVVPYLEGAAAATGGVLPPARYEVATSNGHGGAHGTNGTGAGFRIYDFALKHESSEAVRVVAPAGLTAEVTDVLMHHSRAIFRAFGIRDLGRIDYRVTKDGRVYFLEINALPSLEPGAAMFTCAALVGLRDVDGVLDTVVRTAARRQNVQPAGAPGAPRTTSSGARRRVRVGLVHNLKRVTPKADGADDHEAEFDSPQTVSAIGEAIASHGHDVVTIEATPELLARLTTAEIDVVFNVAEGIRGRSREAVVPALLDLLDLPYTGSDPACLAIAHDKGLAKRLARQAGVLTPDFLVLATGRERLAREAQFPMIVKPLAEGSSKGLAQASVVHTEDALRAAARALLDRYDQPVLAETYLPGREFTVGLLGERRPRVLPPMEIVFRNAANKTPVYTFAHKLDYNDEIGYEVPARLTPGLASEIARVARSVFTAFGCRDVARIDMRLDAAGRVHFLECNPLPGLTPDWSDLSMIAKAAGLDYRALIGEIMSPALRRLRQRERDRRTTSVRP